MSLRRSRWAWRVSLLTLGVCLGLSVVTAEAQPNLTALTGEVRELDGTPLQGVMLRMGGRTAVTDAAGKFQLKNLHAGHQELLINGRTANRPGRTYGLFEVGVDIADGRTTVLAYTIWMPRLDTAHEVAIPSPTITEVVVTNPAIPGLELRIPPNTVIRDVDGKAVTKIGLTQIPPDKPPFPLQPNVIDLPVYFTAQPGAAYVENPTGTGVRIIYPNTRQRPPGWRGDFWHYDPGSRGWYVYGQGAVTGNGSQIAPDPGVGIYELTGAMQGNLNLASPTGATPASAQGAEPVDLSTGIFVYQKTDLTVADIIPLVLVRTYMHQDPRTLTLGRATTHNYDIFLVGDTNPYTFSQLILPDGGRLRYRRISAGTGFTDAVYEHSCPSTGTCTATPTAFYKSQIKWNGAGWDLALRDGTVYTFPDGAPATTPSQAALLRIRDRYGNTVQLARDPTTKLLRRITSPKGRWIEFTYDGQNRIIQAMDNSGRTVLYSYDAQGRLVQVVDPKDGVTQYTYDASNRMATIADARGIVFLTNTYDGNSRVSVQTQADTTTWLLAYTLDQGKVIQTDLTDPRGFVRRLSFNTDGYVLTDVRALNQPEQQTTTYIRSPSGQPGSNLASQMTDPLNRVTTYAYDTAGKVQTITRLAGTADQVVSTFSYEAPFSYQPVSSGVFNRTLTIVPSTATTDGQVTIGYTGLTRTTITDARGKQTLIDYNATGQPTAITDPLSDVTRFEYDPVTADLTAIVDPLMNRTTRSYDAVGRMIRRTDPRGRITNFVYDSLNESTATGDAAGGTTRFAYDSNGNLLSLTDARGNPTQYHYNNMDRMDLRTDPLGRLETLHYNNNGMLDDYTDRKNQRATFTYDGLNRRMGASYLTDGSNTSFQWDGGNRLAQVTDSVGGTVTNTWTPRDRLLSQQTSQGTVTYDQYDTLDRLMRMTPPGQTQIQYSYNPISQLAQVQQGTQTVSLGYDDAARRTGLLLPNGVQTVYAYDNANRLTQLQYGVGGSLGVITYGYDPASNRSSVTGTAARILLPDAVATSSYNAANRQLAFGGWTMTYDDNGNLATLALASDLTQYTWNQRNRLAGISGTNLGASFIYDGLGARISKTMNTVATQFLYDGVDILQDTVNGAPTYYLRGLAIDEPFVRGGSEYYLLDPLSSVIAVTNGAGAITTSYTYEPFGRTEATGTASSNPLQYTGRENDNTGLYYYRGRYYQPQLHRFVAEDPIGFRGGDVNLYAYVRNNPISFSDPTGICRDPGGSGPRYCFNSFIADPTVRGIGRGDWRDVDPNGGTYRSQQFIRPDGEAREEEHRPGLTELWPLPGVGFEGTLGPCGATVNPLPLGGRKIIAWCSAAHGLNSPLDFLGVGDPPLMYYFAIREGANGDAAVVQAYGTPFPSFEVWQYGGPGGPTPLFRYSNKEAGTGIGDLSRGLGPLPLR